MDGLINFLMLYTVIGLVFVLLISIHLIVRHDAAYIAHKGVEVKGVKKVLIVFVLLFVYGFILWPRSIFEIFAKD